MAKTQSILTPYQQEVLEAVAREKYFTERYYLAGGTALAEFYLKHRLSEDLDLFTEKAEVNFPIVARFFERQRKNFRITKIDTKRVFGLCSFFIHSSDGEILKVDFNYYPFPRIESGMKFGNLQIESVYDIGVDKVHTVVLKPRARDYIDLYFIVREYKYDFHNLLMQAKAKFDWDITPTELGARLLQASEMSDYPRMLKEIDHRVWKNFFVAEARKLKKEIFK
ncbi:MAG: hypothetical protein G01um101433_189 [Parcubacteria group bacterium Gr01-1014_33]|nr:MAG: hypothetical protein G01um101433_189 [Parcubacteria group bacterium Gr01-1014_33]